MLHSAGNRWGTVNSEVLSIPALSLTVLAGACSPENLTCSIVRVAGPSNEPVHYHTSYIVGLVVRGEGILQHRAKGRETVHEKASAGDVVIIPRGAVHVFSTVEGGEMDYIAIEFSDQEIDYQAHLPAD